MAKETFGQRLSRLRREKGLTQNEIADRLGVTAQAVSKWENDQASPDIDILLKLSEIFEITLDELLGKEKKTVELKEKPTKKDIGNMFLRIRVQSDDGDKVNVNLPLALVKLFVNKESGKLHFVSGNKALENIDFRQIIDLVEQGTVGEIVSVDSADGDRVSIIVE
ncbi:MAG: helix-turn-helix transcriptional regulator [Bacilli bacterium]|nr:helix-turn-helix transcriptional regulator [Bacilli bacterium]